MDNDKYDAAYWAGYMAANRKMVMEHGIPMPEITDADFNRHSQPVDDAGREDRRSLLKAMYSQWSESARNNWVDGVVTMRALAWANERQDAAVRSVLTQPLYDIVEERNRQITVEGYSKQDDYKSNNKGQLADAAAAYASNRTTYAHTIWPWGSGQLKRTDRRRDLVKAAALIIAEIERIDYLAQVFTGGSKGGTLS